MTAHIARDNRQGDEPMKYLLLMYQNEAAMQKLPKEKLGELHGAFMAYVEAMKTDGVLLANNGLRPTSEATTVRAVNGSATVLNGPFAETKEQLAGYFLIEVPDLDAALAWAKRHPTAAYGSVEVRPVWG
jgi:hypothetical protein